MLMAAESIATSSTRRGFLAASASTAGASAITGSPGATAGHPDSDLTTACEAYHLAHAAYLAPWLDDAHGSVLAQARKDALQRVVRLRWLTPSGRRVKAGVTLEAMIFQEGMRAESDDDHQHSPAFALAVEILLSVAGGAA